MSVRNNLHKGGSAGPGLKKVGVLTAPETAKPEKDCRPQMPTGQTQNLVRDPGLPQTCGVTFGKFSHRGFFQLFCVLSRHTTEVRNADSSIWKTFTSCALNNYKSNAVPL